MLQEKEGEGKEEEKQQEIQAKEEEENFPAITEITQNMDIYWNIAGVRNLNVNLYYGN